MRLFLNQRKKLFLNIHTFHHFAIELLAVKYAEWILQPLKKNMSKLYSNEKWNEELTNITPQFLRTRMVSIQCIGDTN